MNSSAARIGYRPICVGLYTTAGYAHLADGHLVEAAEMVGSIIAEAMAGGTRSRSLS